jgi:hypothetical protein
MKRFLKKVATLATVALFTFSGQVAHVQAEYHDEVRRVIEEMFIDDDDVRINEDGSITFTGGDFYGMTITANEVLRQEKEIAYLTALGESLERTRTLMHLPIVRLAQTDPRWGSVRMFVGTTPGYTPERFNGNINNIATLGCTLTAWTMGANFLGGNYTPSSMNSAMGQEVLLFNWNRAVSRTSSVTSIINRRESHPNMNTFRNTVAGAIANRSPVLIGIGPRGGNSSSHWVIAHGVEGTEIRIHSPGFANHSTLSGVMRRNGRDDVVISYIIMQGVGMAGCSCIDFCMCNWRGLIDGIGIGLEHESDDCCNS